MIRSVYNKKQFLQIMKEVGFSRWMRVKIWIYWDYKAIRKFIFSS